MAARRRQVPADQTPTGGPEASPDPSSTTDGPAAQCSAELARAVKAEAARLGFDLVGIAPAVSPPGFQTLCRWVQAGFHGKMTYVERRLSAYRHPSGVLPGVRSVVVVGLNYRTAEPRPASGTSGRVSRYAWGRLDYHDVVRRKLRRLARFVHQQRPGCRTRVVVDTAPLLERDFARLAGLGWVGKNTLLINRRLGSWLFLGALLVDVELRPDEPHTTDHCGSCRRCLEACPTQAFVEPGVLDARRCLSYLTIELRDELAPPELRGRVGRWVFGCDVCQEVCPWNRKAPPTDVVEFQPGEDLNPVDAARLLALTDRQFAERFGQTPLARPGRAGLLRNAAIVLGNARAVEAVPALVRALSDDEPLVRAAAAWALGQIGTETAVAALKERRTAEHNAGVVFELDRALRQAANVATKDRD